MAIEHVKALVFDTFGTVVDWRTSIIRELREFGAAQRLDADWEALADGWRAGYFPAMDRVRQGQRPWANIDVLHRERLDELLAAAGLDSIGDAHRQHLTHAWHRLAPWPDSVSGLERLKRRYILGTLSNGSVPCLVNMAKHGSLPWDCIFSADLFRHFKPDAEVYLGAVDLLDMQPHEVMMVAAHNGDLRHARSHGLRTAYVNRPQEYGPAQHKDFAAEESWDIVVDDFAALATCLGA
jgi:2-haloacid dehalogenase